MPRPCSICTHSQRQAIDKALVGGATMRELAALYRVSPDAIERHNAAHLPARLVKAAEAEDVKQALDVLVQLKEINSASMAILKDARDQGDGELALKAVDRIFKQIELQAKLLGELEQEGTVNVVLSPQWLQVRTLVLTALAPNPDARGAVAANLATLGAVGG